MRIGMLLKREKYCSQFQKKSAEMLAWVPPP